MNSTILIGRLAKDPEIRYIAESGSAVANFPLAVDRPFAKEKTADFFNISVFGKRAENCEKYLAKGRLVGIQGRLQTRSYETKTGEKRYLTEVIAERFEFLEWGDKKEIKKEAPQGFAELEEDMEDSVPF